MFTSSLINNCIHLFFSLSLSLSLPPSLPSDALSMLFYIMFEAATTSPMGSKPDFHHMMSSSIFLLCCFLTLSLYSISQHTSYSYSLDFTPARKLSMSAPEHDHKFHETQVCLSPINHLKE